MYMLIGPPCSGKTSWTVHCCKYDVYGKYKVVSTDSFIEDICLQYDLKYSEVFKSLYPVAEKIMYKDLQFAINKERTIIWDQTNLGSKSRIKKLKMIPTDYKKIAIVMRPLDLDTLYERSIKRSEIVGKMLSKELLESMINSYQPPTLEEGFDEIIFL